jgi:hypothetical protein
VPRFSIFDAWFRPKAFESEWLYERLGALIIKRYVPTGGDLVMGLLRRSHPERRWVTTNLESLRKYERRTRLNESVHLIGFVGFAALAVHRFASGSLTTIGLAVALALDVFLGLWPVVLQRYNRMRLCRAIKKSFSVAEKHNRRLSDIQGRSACDAMPQRVDRKAR